MDDRGGDPVGAYGERRRLLCNHVTWNYSQRDWFDVEFKIGREPVGMSEEQASGQEPTASLSKFQEAPVVTDNT